MQWIPVEPVEPDPFWGPAAAPRLPRWDGASFYPRPHPGASVPLLWRNAATPLRFAAVLAGLGLFSVFVDQADLLTQLVLGAPLFEEFVKFGLALLLVCWVPRLPGLAGAPTVALRMLVAWGAGAGFGLLEHTISYPHEGLGSFEVRVAFHGAAAGLSMACFTLLETLPDVRARWFSTLPSSFLHYLVNASFPAQVVAALAFPRADLAGGWIDLVTAAALAATLVLPLVGGWARRVAQHQAAERFPALPAAIRATLEPRPGAESAAAPPTP